MRSGRQEDRLPDRGPHLRRLDVGKCHVSGTVRSRPQQGPRASAAHSQQHVHSAEPPFQSAASSVDLRRDDQRPRDCNSGVLCGSGDAARVPDHGEQWTRLRRIFFDVRWQVDWACGDVVLRQLRPLVRPQPCHRHLWWARFARRSDRNTCVENFDVRHRQDMDVADVLPGVRCDERALYLSSKFLADSILSDIIDYDEFLTGKRSEATYFMFKSFLPKVLQIPVVALPVALLPALGYLEPIGGKVQPQVEMTSWYLCAVGSIAVLSSLTAFVIKFRYPFWEPEVEKLSAAITARKATGNMTQPEPISSVPYTLQKRVDDQQQQNFWLLDSFSLHWLRSELHPKPQASSWEEVF